MSAPQQIILSAQTVAAGGNGYYRTITIDHTKVPSTQSNFPIVVTGTYTYLKTVGNGGSVQNANGYDVGFYSDSALTTKLKWETVAYGASTGTVEYWIKIASLSSSSDTVIYMGYGQTSITTDQSDRTNVWDTDFRLVAHMGDGSTIVTNDSSSYSYTGTNTSVTATGGAFASGTLGGAGNFSSAQISFGDNIGANMTGDFTLSYWGYATNWTQVFSKSPAGTGIAKPFDGYIFYTGQQRLWVGDGTSSDNLIESAAAPTSTWTYYTWKMSGTSWSVRKNSAADNSGTITVSRADGTENLLIGHNNPGTEYFAGKLDEMRASGIARSDDWDTTCYNNQSSPSTFYTVGSEVAL